MLNIVLFGPPGSGKGTQSKKITNKFDLVHISTGEILRKEIAKQSPIGIEAQKLIDDGNYVTDDMALEIIRKELDRNANSKGFVFDGFPRTIYQAEKFSEILPDNENDIELMISIEVDHAEIIERLTQRAKESGRADDRQKEIIQKRIEIYNQRTAKVADYYKSLGKFESINGNGEIDVIFDEICRAIEKYI
jgi:adenylate kinase